MPIHKAAFWPLQPLETTAQRQDMFGAGRSQLTWDLFLSAPSTLGRLQAQRLKLFPSKSICNTQITGYQLSPSAVASFHLQKSCDPLQAMNLLHNSPWRAAAQ